MAVFKCKMCGGTIEFEQGATVGICDSCGTKQTLPRLDGDKKTNLYDRANHFRRNNDFDKAMSIYEQILNEDSTDAEAYWSLVLCRYGIEYVEDPSSHKRIPTVNRAQYTSIYMDEDYKSAIANADIYQKSIYEEEAKAIDEIQKGILEISSKEEPFDVFICYKETDNNGRRTPDSVLANDLYHQLVQEGFKVFFSRITLEDKLGSAYEPYIFAALNSAKVMVVLGTKPEYFNAVWVKNEWSRYLALIKSGKKKMLIPAYKDMDPYDLPEEFSHLQAQDMTKLGFMQDLIRGIKKILDADAPKETVKETVVVNNVANSNTEPLLKRAFMFLEDGEWEKADDFCEQVLNINPEETRAYLGKLMAELKIKKEEKLKDSALPFDESNNYQKAYRFADDTMKAKLESDIKFINDRNENARKQSIYDKAKALVKDDIQSLNESISLFSQISGWKDVNMQIENLKKKIEEIKEKNEIARKDDIYSRASNKSRESIAAVEQAIELYKQISGWKDADSQLELANTKLAELKAKEEEERIAAAKARKKAMKITAVVGPIVAAIIVFLIVLVTVIIPENEYGDNYQKGIVLLEEGKYEEAIMHFEKTTEYKDSEARIKECKENIAETKYLKAISLLENENYEEASQILSELEDYKNSKQLVERCNAGSKEKKYKKAEALVDEGKYTEAKEIYSSLGTYKDSEVLMGKAEANEEKELIAQASIRDIVRFGEYEWRILDKHNDKALIITKNTIGERKLHEQKKVSITWEKCTLRKWLNNDFINSTFSEEEQKLILQTNNKTPDNKEEGTLGGNDTIDKVFLLSLEEVNMYFESKKDKICLDSNGENAIWILRTPGVGYAGHETGNFMQIWHDGEESEFGLAASEYNNIRPAMWINLE